ncbi:hypothetical protein L1887_57953 [Cichorium endivia]|nr:hypothetical protein L1887_57953 [Cichorium endivia]
MGGVPDGDESVTFTTRILTFLSRGAAAAVLFALHGRVEDRQSLRRQNSIGARSRLCGLASVASPQLRKRATSARSRSYSQACRENGKPPPRANGFQGPLRPWLSSVSSLHPTPSVEVSCAAHYRDLLDLRTPSCSGQVIIAWEQGQAQHLEQERR